MSIARGFQASYDVVSRALKSRDEAKLKERVGQEGARYGVTEGAYGQGLGENIQQVQGLQQQAIQQARYQGASEEELAGIEQQYAPSIAELQRRQGLTAPDYSVGSRATNYGTMKEAEDASRPMRARGIADVYRQAGEIEKADEVLTQADQAEARIMQREAAGLQLEKARRQAEADARMNAFDAWVAENPGADLAAMKGAASKFKLSQDQVLGVTARMAGLQENELKLWKNEVQNTIKGKSDAELVDIFNKDDRFDPTTNMERKVGKDGSVTLTLKRQDGTVVSTYKAPDAATAATYLRKQALEPETLADWLLERQKTEQAIATSRAQAGAYNRSGQDRGAKPLSESEVTARAKALVETGEAKSFSEALAMAREGAAYMSPVDRLIANMAEAKNRQQAANPPAPAAPAGPTQGLFRDPRGNIQLLQPFTTVNQMRQRMVDEQNARDAEYGLGNIAP